MPDSHHLELFFCFYFFMTSVHALHMVIGGRSPHGCSLSWLGGEILTAALQRC